MNVGIKGHTHKTQSASALFNFWRLTMMTILLFKTPDVLDQLGEPPDSEDCENYNDYIKLKNYIEKFVKYGEMIQIGFDGNEETVTVLQK